MDNPYHGATVGVICEFNPLHNGHAYLLSEARNLVGDDGCVICVMSGRTTQRGEFAITNPYTRAQTALLANADLVVELPFPWSSGSAESFAWGGVGILSQMNCKHLIFGSECGDLSILKRAAAIISSAEFKERYASLCRVGMGTAAAFSHAIREADGSLPETFPSSNDLLGIAYLAAIKKLDANMIPHTVRRMGQDYRDELLTNATYPSATAIRKLIQEAACDPVCLSAVLDGTMPKDALSLLMQEISENRAPVSTQPFYRYAHTAFRIMPTENAQDIAECGNGLLSHLKKCARLAASAEEFMSTAETKQYTNARLRRAMLFATLEVHSKDLIALPSYTCLLAASRHGRDFLAVWRKNDAKQPFALVTKPADAPKGRQHDLGERLDALYTLCLPQPREAAWLLKKTPYIEK